jgi:hypothetical protein
VIRSTSRPLYPKGKCPWYPKNRMVSGYQSCSESFGEEKNICLVSGIEPIFLGCPARNLVTILTTLPWLPVLCHRILYNVRVQFLIRSDLQFPVQTVCFCCSCQLTSSKSNCKLRFDSKHRSSLTDPHWISSECHSSK